MMRLLKTSGLSGVATLLKILTSLLSLKIVSIYTGPEGVAILGQFMALVNIFAVIAGGGISLGVIKYVAEYRLSSSRLISFLGNASAYTLFFSTITLLLGLMFSRYLSHLILGAAEYDYLIRWLAIVQLFVAINTLFCSVINGFEQIKRLVIVNISSSVISMVLVSIMSVYFQLKGTLLAFILSQGLAAFITLLVIVRQDWFPHLLAFRFKTTYWLDLSRYSLMNIISALTVPVAQIIVRNDLNHQFGWEFVGYWQAVLRVSDAYLLFVTTALTAYYLPRLSQLKTNQALKAEMWQSYKILMPIIAVTLFSIQAGRDLIIRILYTEGFEAASDLFLWQLVGDFFRIAGWLLTYLLLAKSWTKMYIATEITLSILFVIISHVLSRGYGLIGASYAFALTYFIYWLIMLGVSLIYFRKNREIIPDLGHSYSV
ncbi:O-antigen translocase [Legionella jordanis]|uniref:Lipopolysaccharide biosynthesis protein n=1 Tax=Legionella jordanis TaxID=456 RepID=A0A0W0VFN7_9GAMM|nr:O-antigen translocase [Legionella jordanis]KTD18979.1 lipopolysaccharide biosynthesis protein [Legionella jordanis]RMX05461.1 O-antigen translocase [Legionella jordanis]RMX19145.1 O-antigen translocase [Legionella jordanis]VEH13080.1 lipopolysaccharide biosynthesis protein [Legionella jordanis]